MKKILIISIAVFLISGFLISQPVIEYDVTKPDVNSHWVIGSTKTIIWNKKGDTYPKVKIRLYSSPGNIKILDIADDLDNTGSFPWNIPVSGLSPGTYYVRVKTENNLNWGNSAPFKIIKKPTFKPPKGMFTPKIKKISSIRPEIKAGDTFLIQGSKFGKIKGKVYISSNLLPNKKIEAVVSYWNKSTKSITCKGPEKLKGVKPHNAKFYIITANNLKSNEVDKLVSGWEEKMLKMGDVVVLQCGEDGNQNHCNSKNVAEIYKEVAIEGFHRNELGAIGDDKGVDRYMITLKNGWVFKSIKEIMWVKSSNNEILDGPHPAFPVGKSEWYPVFEWLVSPYDHVTYMLQIFVEGPIGTNYK